MTLAEQLSSTTRLFLDTAPVIYFVEEHPRYLPLMEQIFQMVDAGEIQVVTSPITLAECLVLPLRQNNQAIVNTFTDLIVEGPSTYFHPIALAIGESAAKLRTTQPIATGCVTGGRRFGCRLRCLSDQ